MTRHLSYLNEMVQMRGHNICFFAELTKIIPKYQYSLPRTLLVIHYTLHISMHICNSLFSLLFIIKSTKARNKNLANVKS